mmetsp:Transcript_23731/g.32387  ORF Transcript_23731/g.32387 Transcript_23731/m.32387 type:complete len:106 (-) Transcript_23731:78-395(-)
MNVKCLFFVLSLLFVVAFAPIPGNQQEQHHRPSHILTPEEQAKKEECHERDQECRKDVKPICCPGDESSCDYTTDICGAIWNQAKLCVHDLYIEEPDCQRLLHHN